MMILHPTDCECEYEYPHTLVISERLSKAPDNQWSKTTTTYVVCRECSHWIGAKPDKCRCPFTCHDKAVGFSVDTKPLSGVDCP